MKLPYWREPQASCFLVGSRQFLIGKVCGPLLGIEALANGGRVGTSLLFLVVAAGPGVVVGHRRRRRTLCLFGRRTLVFGAFLCCCCHCLGRSGYRGLCARSCEGHISYMYEFFEFDVACLSCIYNFIFPKIVFTPLTSLFHPLPPLPCWSSPATSQGPGTSST